MLSMDKHTVLLALALVFTPGAARAQDSDGDGVPDAADLYPCDIALAGSYSYPGPDQHGALLFEDLWPNLGDADFNDAVLTYNYRLRTDGNGRVVSITATYNVLALGGDLDNGLGLHLPIPMGAVASVTRTVGGGAREPLSLAVDADLTVTLSENLRELFGGQGGPINVGSASPVSSPVVQVDIVLSAPVDAASVTGQAPYDVYLFRSGQPGHQIHRTGYGGTASMNSALFGTGSDASGGGLYFRDQRGLPFVIELPVFDLWPQEGVDIASLFPNIIPFATSGGTQSQDFYVQGLDASFAYAGASALQPQLLGSPETPDTSCVPTRVGDAVQVQTGNDFACVLTAAGTVWCWGNNYYGTLGDGTTTPHATPAPVSALSGVVQIAAGDTHACALKGDGTVWCWGWARAGALGDGRVEDSWAAAVQTLPIQVPNLSGVLEVSAGAYFTCARRATGDVWCWGNGNNGELGNGTNIDRATPSQVSGLANATDISAGAGGACALNSNGAVYCWGQNTYGQLGNNSKTSSNVPVQVQGMSNATSVSSSGFHACVTKVDGTAWCWGHNGGYRLGHNLRTTLELLPVQVVNMPSTASIHASGFTCAVRTDGTGECWGGTGPFLGDALTNTSHAAPNGTYSIRWSWGNFLTGITSLSADTMTCATRDDYSVWCWGTNSSGGLGDGATLTSNVPVHVSGF
jgi:LruC domain-containing protein